jgi:hypothetical protein
MPSLNRDRTLRWGVSLLVGAILLAQAATLPLKVSGNSPHTWYWPIIDYPMYEVPHQAGEYVISHRTLEVEHRDGSTRQISGQDIGLSFWDFLYLTGRLHRGEEPSVKLLIDLYDRGSELVKVRVFTPPIILTKQGAQTGESKMLSELVIDESLTRSRQ